MVADRDAFRARAVLRDNGVADVARMSFAPAELTRDAFLDGRLRLWQPRARLPRRHRPGAARRLRPGPRPASACSTSAAAPAPRRSASPPASPASTCTGSSCSPPTPSSPAATPPRTASRSPSTRATCAARPPALRRAASSTTCSPTRRSTAATPPAAADPGRDRAHREAGATLADWIAAGLRRLAPGGRLVLIHRTGRLAEILAALAGRAGRDRGPADRRRAPGGRPRGCWSGPARAAPAPLTLWPPLTFHAGSSHTPRRGAAILPRRRGCCATWRNCCRMHA